MNFDWHISHYNYQEKEDNLKASASGVVKSDKFFPIFLTMCFMAGIPTRYILMVFMFGVCTIVFTILPYWDDIVLGRSLPVMRVFTDFRITLLAVIVLSFILALSMAGRFIFKSKYYFWKY